jgi:leucyl-tRNA synthetase
MAVPAHDARDNAFAKKFGLPIRTVVVKEGNGGKSDSDAQTPEDLYEGMGMLMNSGGFDGKDAEAVKWEIVKLAGGVRKTQYKIRDWSVSRQRYWGVPIPMIHCPKDGVVPVPEAELPVLLPVLKDWRPQGTAPLASSPEYMNVRCPACGGPAQRDPETFDTFVDSSWYFLRYADPHNAAAIFDKEKVRHWMPVDLYVIGAEHTVLHLLYSRFFTKFLHDEGLIDFDEPFLKLRHQGLIRGADGQKMSKSKGNVVNPDELVGEYGADTVRVYEMFMGPFEDGAPWDPKGILGAHRFLSRVWQYVIGCLPGDHDARGKGPVPAGDARPALHRTIKKVGEDIPAFKFNTAISALMILMNELEKSAPLAGDDLASFVKLVHPFAPHMAQELWSRIAQAGGSAKETYLDFEPWPTYDPALFAEEETSVVLQVNGKVRDIIRMPRGTTEAAAKEAALANDKVRAVLGDGGTPPKRIIWVPDKLVNIVL